MKIHSVVEAPRERQSIFSLPSALILSGLLLSWTLTYPLSIDSSVHASMAWLLTKGYLPYRSVWENNFPGTILFVHLPEMLLFGHSTVMFHVWDILWELCGTFFLYRIIENASDKQAAWISCLLVTIFYVTQDNLMVAQRDCYATIVLLASIYLLQKYPHWKSVLLSGLLYGIAILIRPTNEALALVLACWLIVSLRGRTGFQAAVLFVCSAQIFLVLFVIWYVAAGAFTDFYTIAIRFNAEVYAHTMPLSGLLYPFPRYWILLLGLPFAFKSMRKEWFILLASLLVVTLLTLVPQKRYLYQYHTAFVLSLAIAGIGWTWVLNRLPFHPIAKRAVCVVGVIAVLLWYSRGTTQKRILTEYLQGRISTSQIQWSYDDSPKSGFAILDSVSRYLHDHTAANETAQFVGEYAYPYLAAERRPTTRFITFHSLMLRGATGQLSTYQMEWRKELIDTIRAVRPPYIIVVDAPDYARGHLNGLLGHEIIEKDLIQLDSIVVHQYHPETIIGAFTFYRINKTN